MPASLHHLEIRPRVWKIEKFHTLYCLMFYGWAFKGFTVPSPLLANLSWALAVGPALLFSSFRLLPIARSFFLREPFMMALIALAGLSTSWSLLPGLSAHRSVQLLLTFQYACYLSVVYSWAEILSLTRLALRLGILFSGAFTLIRPELCVHIGDIQAGQWKGLFGHKNHSGRVASLLCSLSLGSALTSGWSLSRWWNWLWVAIDLLIGAIVLKAAGSRTAILVFFGVAAVCLPLRVLLKSRASMRLGGMTLATASLGLLLPALPLLYGWATATDWNRLLTGRVTLWRTVYYFVSRHPWTGYGYGAFFQDATFARLILLAEGWAAPHSHHVLLELLTDLGVTSVALYLATMWLYHWRALRAWGSATLIAVSVSVFNILTGMTETACYPEIEIGTLLFMAIAVTHTKSARTALAQVHQRPEGRADTGEPTEPGK